MERKILQLFKNKDKRLFPQDIKLYKAKIQVQIWSFSHCVQPFINLFADIYIHINIAYYGVILLRQNMIHLFVVNMTQK